MSGENRQLVAHEPVEVHQDFMRMADHFRQNYRIELKFDEEILKDGNT